MLRVVHHNRGPSFVPKCKFVLDAVKGTVYVLVEKAKDVELMTGRCFHVDDEHITFFRVLKMEKRSQADDFLSVCWLQQDLAFFTYAWSIIFGSLCGVP